MDTDASWETRWGWGKRCRYEAGINAFVSDHRQMLELALTNDLMRMLSPWGPSRIHVQKW